MPQSVTSPRQKDSKNNTANPAENSQVLQPISARIEKGLYRNLKVYSAQNDIKMNALIELALRTYIQSS